MARRSRQAPLGRRAPFRDRARLILVVCEGAVTEPQYFEGFKTAQRTPTVRVRIEAPGGDPLALVERAVAIRVDAAARARRTGDDTHRIDEVWCVLDTDQHARLFKARELAVKEGISLAVSNPCFELWLLLHFVDHAAHVTTEQLRRNLAKYLPQYDKHLRFDDLEPGYPHAVRRADALERHHAELDQQGANPSTGVHRLTERIREFGKDARLNAPR